MVHFQPYVDAAEVIIGDDVTSFYTGKVYGLIRTIQMYWDPSISEQKAKKVAKITKSHHIR